MSISYEVVVDGACRANADGIGQAAAAVLIYKHKKLIGQLNRGLGIRTAAEAEFEAVLLGVQLCWAAQLPNPVIYTDARMVVNAHEGTWQRPHASVIGLMWTLSTIAAEYPFRLFWVPRREVAAADALCNTTLDAIAESMMAFDLGEE